MGESGGARVHVGLVYIAPPCTYNSSARVFLSQTRRARAAQMQHITT